MIVELETMSAADNVFRIVGTQKYLTLTDEEIVNAQVGEVQRGAHLDMALVLRIARKVQSLVAEGLIHWAVDFEGAATRPANGPPAPPVPAHATAPTAPTAPPETASTGPLPAPPQPAPQPPDLSVEDGAEVSERREALAGFGINFINKRDENLPYLVNDEAGRDGSLLTTHEVSQLVSLYEGADKMEKVGIVMKLTGIPMRILSQSKDSISKEIRAGVVEIILARDGIRSDFVPAELANFMADGPGDASSSRLLKLKHTKAEVGEDFDKTSAMSSFALYRPKRSPIPTATEFKERN